MSMSLTGCGSLAAQGESSLQRVASASSLPKLEFIAPHMGMQARIVMYVDEPSRAKAAADAAFAEIARLDAILSDWRDDSEVAKVNAAAGGEPVHVSADFIRILQRSIDVSRASDGAFDVTIGPLTQLWRQARTQQRLPCESEIEAAHALVDWRAIEVAEKAQTVRLAKPGMRLDFGGIGKGYAADRARATLQERSIASCLVALAGDIALGDPPPGSSGWRIAIDDGISGQAVTFELANCGVSTSGDAEQFLLLDDERRSHIVAPSGSGLGLTRRIAVTVIARDATTADALATAASVLGTERGLEMIAAIDGAAARFATIDQDSVRVNHSPTFPASGGRER